MMDAHSESSVAPTTSACVDVSDPGEGGAALTVTWPLVESTLTFSTPATSRILANAVSSMYGDTSMRVPCGE